MEFIAAAARVICAGLVVLFIIVFLWVIARFTYKDGETYGSEPVILDPNDPADRYEARCIEEQMRWGRERNGYKWHEDL